MSYANLPAPSPEQGLNRYMQEIRKFPMLEPDEEYMLGKAWIDHEDTESAHKLVTSHLRLAAKIAMGYRGYGLPTAEVISEANVGLMQAVKRFEPEKGFRLSTYAMWWIKASVQDYVMRNWSMVRTGSTSSQKSLFFNMRRVQARLERESESAGVKLDKHQLMQMISTEIGVPLHDVEMMEGRLSGSDYSLNATQSVEDEGREWIDALEDNSAQAAEVVEHAHDTAQLRSWLFDAMAALSERERFIVRERKLQDNPRTLESLGKELSLSKERVRQLEAAAFGKMRKWLETHGTEVQNFLN